MLQRLLLDCFINQFLMKKRIENKLGDFFGQENVGVQDVSYRHRGHIEENPYETHFDIKVKSEKFKSMTQVARHKLVYELLEDEIKLIHAISIGTIIL
ncbi:MAG: BolA family transcriptional regulator [Candidatus Midichloria mitochondrii]|nr:BolA family transcriptional regulator [Candidatus Midichloria mitochondrii]MDJ1288256.1 BolA family transcriptional regulator [Candidatus Midichloria mitochondrii]MDJ1299093.1 BolA family transcriptional regulator [Candidatus Midichloria mitochondrii]MDJ1313261.1 BolA family transcriptional regulator [Candidatus Midichloria mitochondrii]MDJ1583826.1 BolA family transcriptional regulator [Candidatus Midichloria mitochondrii]